MLQNAYLLAKIGADTAENERYFVEHLLEIGNYPTGPLPCGSQAPAPTSNLPRPLSGSSTDGFPTYVYSNFFSTNGVCKNN